MFRLICIATLLTMAGQLTVAKTRAQVPSRDMEFEVASVRQSDDAEGMALLQATPRRLTLARILLQRLLLIAYDIQDSQLSGEPSWVGSDRFDIVAKASDRLSVQQMMLQALLEDRFKMRLHRETRCLVPEIGGLN